MCLTPQTTCWFGMWVIKRMAIKYSPGEIFHTNRQLQGLSGFPKKQKAGMTLFGVGHSSTSISAALGMAMAAKVDGKRPSTYRHYWRCIDSRWYGFEALNHAGITQTNLLVILNDNAIGIDQT